MAVPVKRHPLSEREKCLLLMVICLALLLVASRFLFVPLLEGAATLRAEQEQLLGEQKRLQALLRQAERIRAQHESLQPEKDYLMQAIPSRAELPPVLGRFEELLHGFPVSVEALQIGELETENRCTALPVRLSITGEEGEAMQLLERVEQFAHLLLIDRLAWSRGEEAVSLELSCRLIFFEPESGKGR